MKRALLVTAIIIAVVSAIIIAAISLLNHHEASASATATDNSGTPTRPEFQRSESNDPPSTRVYHTLLPSEPGDEWSEPIVSQTKKGDRPYLGDFHPADPITRTIPALPPHKLVRISFDLFLFRSWDGSSPYYGYAKWDLTADDQSLIHTTFNNCGFFGGGNDKQAFPDTWPSRWHLAWTLATEHETLGMPQSWGTFTADASCVYHMDLTFPHSGPNVVFQFLSDMKGGDKRKLYGLTNVVVSTLPELASYSPGQIASMWNDLGSSDPAVFWKAQWDLAQAGDAATNFIADHVSDNIDMTPEAAAKLFDQLQDNDREGSPVFDRLSMQGRTLSDLYDKTLASNSSHTQQIAALKALAVRYPATATELRNTRAKHLLGIIHTPAALALADKIVDQPLGPEK